MAYRKLFLKSWISRISVGRHICIRKGTHSSNQNTCVHLNSLGRRWEVFISATSSFKLAQKRLYLRFAQESNIRYSMYGTRNQYAVVWNLQMVKKSSQQRKKKHFSKSICRSLKYNIKYNIPALRRIESFYWYLKHDWFVWIHTLNSHRNIQIFTLVAPKRGGF